MVNEARFNFGERRATFTSQNKEAVAFNITGTAFIGRELFSPVVRTETRYEWTDNLSVVAGNHSLKFGGDFAFVRIPSAVFELNFAGLFNFRVSSTRELWCQRCQIFPAPQHRRLTSLLSNPTAWAFLRCMYRASAIRLARYQTGPWHFSPRIHGRSGQT